MRRLRIGIDGGSWSNARGPGRHVRSLVSALAAREDGDRYVLFVDRATAGAEDLPRGVTPVVVETREAPGRAAAPDSRRTLGDLWRMSRAVARTPLDVFFFPSVGTFFPLFPSLPSIVQLHDVTALRYPRLLFAHRHNELFSALKRRVALWRARVVVTPSEESRSAIVRRLGFAPDRVRVIAHAPDAVFMPIAAPRDPADLLPGCRLPRGARYLLYVGAVGVQKNLSVLIEAYRRLVAGGGFEELRLLVVGDYSGDFHGAAQERLRAEAERLGIGDRICFPGWVADGVLVELYNRADVLVLPSLEEGFGLTAFEAAACGTAVVVADPAPAGRLLGSGSCGFAPNDPDALTSCLRALLEDPARRRAMGIEGRRRAATFTWERAAEELHGLIHEVADQSSSRTRYLTSSTGPSITRPTSSA